MQKLSTRMWHAHLQATISFTTPSHVESGLALLRGIKTQKPRSPKDPALDLDPGDGLRHSCFPTTLKTLDFLVLLSTVAMVARKDTTAVRATVEGKEPGETEEQTSNRE